MIEDENMLEELIDEQIADSKRWAINGFNWPKRDYLTYNLALLMYWLDMKELIK